MIGHQFHLIPSQQATCSQTQHQRQAVAILTEYLCNLVISIVYAKILCYESQCNPM
jgi:hypothetical protein